jgi:voltage-gated potassium channel
MKALRVRVFELLDGDRHGDRPRTIMDIVLVSLILISTAAIILESDKRLAADYLDLFDLIEIVVVIAFTVEYAGRIWAAPEHPRFVLYSPMHARLRYMISPLALIDLAAILPFYLAFVIPADLRFRRLFRLITIFKIAHYSPALVTMGYVVRKQWRTVFGSLYILGVLLVVSSGFMYMLERNAQPEVFGSILDSMWWAMATLTTVGYGDVTPVTAGGRIVGSIVMVLGIGVFALWTSIFAAGYMEEASRRKFVVTWNLVAKVPAFSVLDAERISDIVELLSPEIVPARYTIIRRGEVADAMYFVISGELEVDMPNDVYHVHDGQFFGARGLLEGGARRATVTTLTECQLLRLDKRNFTHLMEAEPGLREAIEAEGGSVLDSG